MRFQEPHRLKRNLTEIGEMLGLPAIVPARDLSEDLGSLYLSSNRFGDAIAEFRRALEEADGMAYGDRAAVREKLAWCYYWTGAYSEAERLIRAPYPEGDERPGARVLEGRIALERGDLAKARAEGDRALARAIETDCAEWIGPARSLLGVVAQREGLSAEAREHFEEAMLSYRIAGDEEGECRTAIHLGTLAKSECDWSEAFRSLDRARRRAEGGGFLYLYGSASLNRGNLSYRLGSLADSETSTREALRVFSDIGYELGAARARIALARIALDRARIDELRSHLDAARVICAGGRFPREAVLIEEVEGLADAARGFGDRAEEKLRGALALACSIAAGGDAAVTIELELADLLLTRGAAEEAERLAIDLSEPLASVADPSLEGRRRRVLAEAALARGDSESARKEVAKGIRFFERIGCRAETARAYAVAGRVEASTGGRGSREKALAFFLSAKRIAEEIGEARILARVSVESALCWIGTGAGEEARAALDLAAEAFRRLGDENGEAEARGLAAELAPADEPAGSPFGKTVTGDPATIETLRIAERVSCYPVTVLIEGETGTGKQLLARAIHEASPRADKPFVTVNCASLPEQILESELFGYVKGAFTGATEDRKGLFEEADGGTIFLDEIGKAGPHVQRSLLHVLDQGFIRPIGSTRTRRVDARVICATSNLDLKRDIQEDRFLKDLFYRINDITLCLPPLRERSGDVSLLSDHFLRRFRRELGRPSVRFSAAVERLFSSYSWPGNVRELEKAVLHAVLLASGDRIDVEHLPADLVFDRDADGEASGLKEEVEALERRRVVEVLDQADWNRSRAARELGLSLRGLRNKIRRYRLEGAPRRRLRPAH